MALKKCKECGNEVSTKAKKCPNCGAPVKASSSVGCLTIIGVIFLIGLFGSLFDEKDSTTTTKTSVPKKSWSEQNNSTMAYIMMEDFVKQQQFSLWNLPIIFNKYRLLLILYFYDTLQALSEK